MTISHHKPLQNKVRRLYFISCIFYVASRAFVKEPFLNLRTSNHNTVQVNASMIPSRRPSLANVTTAKVRETDTR